jgi:hypothetical protein
MKHTCDDSYSFLVRRMVFAIILKGEGMHQNCLFVVYLMTLLLTQAV